MEFVFSPSYPDEPRMPPIQGSAVLAGSWRTVLWRYRLHALRTLPSRLRLASRKAFTLHVQRWDAIERIGYPKGLWWRLAVGRWAIEHGRRCPQSWMRRHDLRQEAHLRWWRVTPTGMQRIV